jgi:hypothetical protein
MAIVSCRGCVDCDALAYKVGLGAGGAVAVSELALVVARIGWGVTSRVAIHNAHHTFRIWGKRAHFLVNVWIPGVKKSGRWIHIPLLWR